MFVRMNSGEYLIGQVKAVENLQCSVYVHGLEKTLQCDIEDPTAVVPNLLASRSKLTKGARVVFWKESKYVYHLFFDSRKQI